VERRAVQDGCARASEGPPGAAAGNGGCGRRAPIADAVGNLIVDIGGGTTDVAVIALAGIVQEWPKTAVPSEFGMARACYLLG
jgi:rod shape-determining protein MreB